MKAGTEESRLPERLPLLVLMSVAGLVRLSALMHPERLVWGDEPFYLWLGRNWLTGRGYSFTGYSDVHHTPLYPLLSGLLYLLTNNLELASNICYLLFGVLLLLPVFCFARELYGKSAGYATVALLAVHPAVATAPAFWGTLTEPPYYFFVYTGLWLVLLAMRRDEVRFYAGAGICFGLAYLTRPEAIAYVAVALAVLVVVRLAEGRLLQRATLSRLTVYGCAFLLLFLPYAFYVYQETGSWMVSEKAGVTFVTCLGLSEGDTRAFDEATWGLDTTGCEVFFFSRESYDVSMFDVIRAYPAEFVQLLVRNARRFLGSLLSTRLLSYYLLPLLGLALFRSVWDRSRAKGELLLLASLAPVLVFLLFFVQDRYIATLMPTLLIWLGLGVHELGTWFGDTWQSLTGRILRNRGRTAAYTMPVILLVLLLVSLQPKAVALYTSTDSFRVEHRTVGYWLRNNIPTDSVVMSRYPAIAFYGEARWEPTPNAGWEQMLVYARAQSVDYFVLDEMETHDLRPQYAFLFDQDQVPDELSLVHLDATGEDRLAVFRVNPR